MTTETPSGHLTLTSLLTGEALASYRAIYTSWDVDRTLTYSHLDPLEGFLFGRGRDILTATPYTTFDAATGWTVFSSDFVTVEVLAEVVDGQPGGTVTSIIFVYEVDDVYTPGLPHFSLPNYRLDGLSISYQDFIEISMSKDETGFRDHLPLMTMLQGYTYAVEGGALDDFWDTNQYRTDRINLGEGEDTIIARPDPMQIDGGDGIDQLSYAEVKFRDPYTDNVEGILYFSGKGEAIKADGSRDSIAGIEIFLGTDGPDTLLGGPMHVTLHGGDGDDFLRLGRAAGTLHGGKGEDSLTGSMLADHLLGLGGADLLKGRRGDDLLEAGGVDPVSYHVPQPTESQMDTLMGGPGNDTLLGGRHSATLIGGSGDDLIHFVGDGQGAIISGSGDDTILAIDMFGKEANRDYDFHGMRIFPGVGADTIILRSDGDTSEITSRHYIGFRKPDIGRGVDTISGFDPELDFLNVAHKLRDHFYEGRRAERFREANLTIEDTENGLLVSVRDNPLVLLEDVTTADLSLQDIQIQSL